MHLMNTRVLLHIELIPNRPPIPCCQSPLFNRSSPKNPKVPWNCFGSRKWTHRPLCHARRTLVPIPPGSKISIECLLLFALALNRSCSSSYLVLGSDMSFAARCSVSRLRLMGSRLLNPSSVESLLSVSSRQGVSEGFAALKCSPALERKDLIALQSSPERYTDCSQFSKKLAFRGFQ